MRISAVSVYTYRTNSNFNQRLNKQNQHSVAPNFRGFPWALNPQDMGISNYGEITASDAIQLYSKLACGNYLDIGEDSHSFYNCNRIRENNLAFLDRVTSPREQKKFIEYYKNLTGFPNLELVSDKIKNEFIKAIDKTSKDLYYPKYQIVQAGYDGVCSVGRKKALPGSDIDKAYVIIRGTGYEAEDIECVNNFKGGIWNNTDQRILSYNHDEAAFPQVYTLNQLKRLVKAAEEQSKIMGEYRIGMYSFFDTMFYRQIATNGVYQEDYVAANPYYIKLCNRFPKVGHDGLDIYCPTRENIKNIGFMLEAMREGEIFPQFGKITDLSVVGSSVYKLVNLSQLKALKNHCDRKPKRLARESLRYDFDSWSINKQYRFITTLIKSSCANNRNFTAEFPQYFSKAGQDLFAPLIKALMR